MRGEVLARWQEFVGTGEWMRALQGQVSRLRDRVVSAVTGRPTPVDDLQGALENSVERLLRAESDRAAERTVLAWRSLPAGAALVAGVEPCSTWCANRVRTSDRERGSSPGA